MNDPNDADANEDAARRIQEQIWMAEAEEEGAEDDVGIDVDMGGGGDADPDDDDDGDNNDDDNDDDNNGAVQDFVRQLLDRDEGRAQGAGDDDDANDNDAPADDIDGDDEDGDAAANRRGAMDAGIAGEVRDENSVRVSRSLKCPLVLYFECACDDLDKTLGCPGNPVLRRGATAYVGLDKNTKLSLVFERYCAFVNSKTSPAASAIGSRVKMSDLEFLHCTLLDANQTVEASAMMKNDRVKVHSDRSRERSSRAEQLRQQRESDRKYFKDLRQMLPNPSPEGMGCDVVLDCRGKVMDERGYSQNVLATTVRANSVLISKRCKWLGQRIAVAREEGRRRAEMTVPEGNDEGEKSDDEGEDGASREGVKSSQSDDEDDIIMAEPVARAGNDNNNNNLNNNNIIAAGGEGNAHKVEDVDDEDDEPAFLKPKVAKATGRNASGSLRKPDVRSNPFPNSVWVTLDHSPQAVKLLLEYCYTNRVQSLGHEAFVRSSKYPDPRDVGAIAARQAGPVPPFRKHEWPEGGAPAISLHLALAGIALAEEAHCPRLSLMCEIAASRLVDGKNVVDVLSACRAQQQRTGNRLPVLRKAAVLDCIMAGGGGGIDQLYANESFRSNLVERRGLVIPSLLDGTVEVMPANMNTKEIRRKKDKMVMEKRKMFELNDSSDKTRRTMERMKWRKTSVVKRRMEVAYGPDDERRALKMPPKTNIFRDSFQRDPPPALGGKHGGRGTKRKGGSSSRSSSSAAAGPGGGGGSGGGASGRNVRRRQTRRTNNLA